MNYSIPCLGETLTASVVWLDDGVDVGIFGGCRTHVGAVTLAEANGKQQTLLRENHRDDVIGKQWASRLAERWRVPVCVRCGIHYEGVNREQIDRIVSAARTLLEQVLEQETP